MKIGIIGGGVWGSAIAKLLSNNKVCIISRDTKIVTSINEHRFNPRLKYAGLNENVSATADLNEAKDMDYLFLTLPSQKIRDVLSKVDLIIYIKFSCLKIKFINTLLLKYLKHFLLFYLPLQL